MLPKVPPHVSEGEGRRIYTLGGRLPRFALLRLINLHGMLLELIICLLAGTHLRVYETVARGNLLDSLQRNPRGV